SAVLVVEVVGMLPYVESEIGRPLGFGNVHQRVIPIRRGCYGEILVLIYYQPGPAGSKPCSGRIGKLGLEFIEASESAINSLGQSAAGLSTSIGTEYRPEQAMIIMTSAIVADGSRIL